ncbi:MAG: CRTAC1 family protein [Planctomycetota bacterium]
MWSKTVRACLAGTLISAFVTASRAQTWIDVTSASGISPIGSGSGCAWGDYDGDGLLDLAVSSEDFWLYKNMGDGTFADRTAEAGLACLTEREPEAMVWGDYDNDGHLDLLASTFFITDTPRLFHNDGDGTFTELNEAAGFVETLNGRAAWCDYDRDGWLDFILGSVALYHNNGDGTFAEVATQAGLDTSACCEIPAWGDYDNDGWPDLYVARYNENRLYHNLGDGTFAEVGAATGTADTRHGRGTAWGDYDNDGWLDIYISNGNVRNTLLHNNGDETFTDVTYSSGTPDYGDGRTCHFLDYDCDGWPDIFTSNHIAKNRLYHSDGDGTFTDRSMPEGILDPGDAFGVGFCDYDNDGDLDVFLATHYDGHLLQHQGLANHYLIVQLEGTISNRAAIGARVEIRPVVSGDTIMTRVVRGGDGQYGQDSLELEFGLGAYICVEELRVYWPSGLETVLTDVPADQRLLIVESGSSPGDLDGDGDVDLDDFSTFAVCMAGPDVLDPPPGCDPADFANADLNSDGDVDLADFAVFQTAFTGQ